MYLTSHTIMIMIVNCEFVLSTQNLNTIHTLHIALCISNAQICLQNPEIQCIYQTVKIITLANDAASICYDS